MEIKDRLNLILEKEKISQSELSRMLDFGKGNISNYFSGKENPGRKFLTLLQEKLNISSDWLLTGKGSMYIGEEKATPAQLPEWLVNLDATTSELQEFAQTVQKDKHLLLLFFKARAGDKQAIEDLCQFLKFRCNHNA